MGTTTVRHPDSALESSMADFAAETVINAPVEHVWKALANIGSIYEWNPGGTQVSI